MGNICREGAGTLVFLSQPFRQYRNAVFQLRGSVLHGSDRVLAERKRRRLAAPVQIVLHGFRQVPQAFLL